MAEQPKPEEPTEPTLLQRIFVGFLFVVVALLMIAARDLLIWLGAPTHPTHGF